MNFAFRRLLPDVKVSLMKLKANAEKERAYFDNPKSREQFNDARKKNEMDVKFCWN